MLRVFTNFEISSQPSTKTSKAQSSIEKRNYKKFFSENPKAALKLGSRHLRSFVHLYDDWHLDEEVREYRLEHSKEYGETIRRLDDWFVHNKLMFIKMFCNTFESRDASFVNFKAFLKDMDFPATAFETHMVCLLFDLQENKGLSLYNFQTRLRVLLKIEEMKDAKNDPKLREESYLPKIESYVDLKLYSIDFLEQPNYKGHTRAILSTNSSMWELIDVLDETVKLIYRTYNFYREERDKVHPELAMPPTATLEEFGIEGGPRARPTKAKMYYSFRKFMTTCPLLRYMPHETIRQQFMERRATIEQRLKYEFSTN